MICWCAEQYQYSTTSKLCLRCGRYPEGLPVLRLLWDVDEGVLRFPGDYEMRFSHYGGHKKFVQTLRAQGIYVVLMDHDQGTTEEG